MHIKCLFRFWQESSVPVWFEGGVVYFKKAMMFHKLSYQLQLHENLSGMDH
ncbi:hypothetical protein D8674_032192 [Pyrus ussuriensis x Pyrus communis]|uniref:Uncharacterized protein n=1 Tax=Pyrus ussuriensis x Pyrus communis TaxID=2448454 RepID=A0A5N5F677_9ROSA|nr:hypothetical protein D8674_032192 [Pyrus ussuriensis x Pyrus communis]